MASSMFYFPFNDSHVHIKLLDKFVHFSSSVSLILRPGPETRRVEESSSLPPTSAPGIFPTLLYPALCRLSGF